MKTATLLMRFFYYAVLKLLLIINLLKRYVCLIKRLLTSIAEGNL